MGQGKQQYKWELPFKLCFVFLFIGYLGFAQTFWYWVWPDANLRRMYASKSRLHNQQLDIAIIGGSNAVYGISAQTFNANHLKSYNLALSPHEGGNAFDMAHWLKKHNNTAKIVVYSSMNVWFLNDQSPFGDLLAMNFIKPQSHWLWPAPLISTLRRWYLSPLTDNIHNSGDVTRTPCDPLIEPFPSHLVSWPKNNLHHLQAFIARAQTLQKSLQGQQLYIRIPPVYITENTEPLFRNYINEVVTALAENGVKAIGAENSITYNKEIMCFGPNHPTLQAAENYTQALIHEIYP